MFPYSLQPAISFPANQEHLSKFLHCIFWNSPVMVCNQHIWPHQTVTHKLYTYPSKGLASLQTSFLIISESIE